MDATAPEPLAVEQKGISPGRSLSALLVLAFINLVNQIDRRGLVTIFPLLQSEWGLTDTQLGLAVSLFTLGRAIIALPAGWLADQKGTLKVLRPVAILWSVFGIFSGWARTFTSFVSFRIGVGLADGANGPLDLAYLGGISPKARRGLYLSIYSIALYAGSALGVVFAGAVGEHYGWRWVLVSPGVLGLLAAMGLFFVPSLAPTSAEDIPAALAPCEPRSFSWLLARPLPAIFLGGSLGVFASTALVSWLPTYLTRMYEVSLTRAGFYTGALILPASILGTVLGGVIGDRFAKKNPLARTWISGLGLVLAMVFGLAGLFSVKLAATIAWFFLSAFCFTLPVSPLLVIVQDSVTKNRLATTQAAFGLATQVIGAAPATALVGYLSDLWGLKAALTLPFLAAALGGLLITLGRVRGKVYLPAK